MSPFDTSRYYSAETHPSIPPELGRLPSVTTITDCYPKPWMFAWAKKFGIGGAEQKKAEALDVGSRVHECIHRISKGEAIDLTKEQDPVQKALEAFLRWKDQVHFSLVDTEQVVFSQKHRYAGRLDSVAWVEGQLALIDYKTSKDLYAEAVVQIAAYGVAYEECRPILYGSTNEPLRRLLILRLGKDLGGAFEPYDVTALRAEAFEQFLRLRGTWEFQRNWQDQRKRLEPSWDTIIKGLHPVLQQQSPDLLNGMKERREVRARRLEQSQLQRELRQAHGDGDKAEVRRLLKLVQESASKTF